MPAFEISPGISWIGINDRTTDLFEGLWPISREGVSYNSYLIKDDRRVIIDLAKAFKGDEFLSQIDEITDVTDIDYIVVNHMEPDHSGLLRTIRRLSPDVKILGSAKTRQMLEGFYGITQNVEVVGDGDTLELGKHTLKFFSTPFLHWPETIMTYEEKTQTLFSCDAFGGYGALHGSVFDDDCGELEFYIGQALRYYANIVGNYSARVLSAIDKLKDIPVKTIAPSHGLIWRKNPGKIIDLYHRWAGYEKGECEPGVTLMFGSMYGNTEAVMNAVAQGMNRADVPVEIFDVARVHSSYILASLWEKKGVMVGAPTYEVALFPPMAQALDMAARKHIRGKKAGYFGSYGWSKGALREMKSMVEPLGWDITHTFEFNGHASPKEIREAEEFGYTYALTVR
jgi:anaerobic nitric oxide reductase flavorubredoxin